MHVHRGDHGSLRHLHPFANVSYGRCWILALDAKRGFSDLDADLTASAIHIPQFRMMAPLEICRLLAEWTPLGLVLSWIRWHPSASSHVSAGSGECRGVVGYDMSLEDTGLQILLSIALLLLAGIAALPAIQTFSHRPDRLFPRLFLKKFRSSDI